MEDKTEFDRMNTEAKLDWLYSQVATLNRELNGFSFLMAVILIGFIIFLLS